MPGLTLSVPKFTYVTAFEDAGFSVKRGMTIKTTVYLC